MTPFIIIGGIGLVAVLISLFFGELFDLLDGALSLTAIGSAFTVFGAIGAITIANGLPSWSAYLISAIVGIAVLFGVQGLIRAFKRSEDGAPADPTGLYGTARSRITAASGEVSLDGPHEVETRMAFAEPPIAAGTRIRVVEVQGTRVRVVPADSNEQQQ